MSKDPSKDYNELEAHVFICTNNKDGKSSCAPHGANELRDTLKALSKDDSKGWKGRVRINNAGCLGRCKEGVACVIYPQAEWHTDLRPQNAKDLEKRIDQILRESN